MDFQLTEEQRLIGAACLLIYRAAHRASAGFAYGKDSALPSSSP
jgi:hypothetical protein